ncbi:MULTISPECIES: ferredoxin [Glutamicibacter]|uniref:ferredoxin n=1 Tax=Glutamicibacter TaxID=1742989 RepID=UPI0011F36AC3|nr:MULTISPECIES: ferredoxin [Glutamicibacter]QEP09042.1 ferredoxin [Glutamicibacter sp. ZJUTW]
MAIVKADLKACQGYANCMVGTEDYFDLDDDGLVVILKETVDAADRKRIVDAARSCPVSALTVVDE